MPAEAAIHEWARFELFYATGVHVAGKEEHAGDARGSLLCEDHRDAGAVAPSDYPRVLELQCIHHRQDVGGHQLIAVWPLVACAAAVATAIDEDGAIAVLTSAGSW